MELSQVLKQDHPNKIEYQEFREGDSISKYEIYQDIKITNLYPKNPDQDWDELIEKVARIVCSHEPKNLRKVGEL